MALSSKNASFESKLMQAWQTRGFLACLLWPISLIFRFVVTRRIKQYASGARASTRLSVPVIIVGNIFIGGTGKTPFIIWLANTLRQQGYTPGVISRGYGGKNAQALTDTSLPGEVGDEPLLIRQQTGAPVHVGRDRVATAQALLAANPTVDIILSDDGLQHYALQRDIEIILCDDRQNGNGWMLPAGPLREPADRKRHFTVINTTKASAAGPHTFSMQLKGAFAEHLTDRHKKVALREFTSFAEKNTPRAPLKIAAAAGIGNPERFFSHLSAADIAFEKVPLPDHFDYKINPFLHIDADFILITEKDAVKCAFFDAFQKARLWVVPVSAQIDFALAEAIMESLHEDKTA